MTSHRSFPSDGDCARHSGEPQSTSRRPDDPLSRRDLMAIAAAAAALGAVELPQAFGQAEPPEQPATGPRGRKPWSFEISLAQWSLHREIRDAKKLEPSDFPKVAKRDFGVSAVEYVNQFYMDKAGDTAYFQRLKKRCDDEGVVSLLIMCDHQEALGDPDAGKRAKAVEVHTPWLEAAAILGCHSIRVNVAGGGTPEEHSKQAAESLRKLCELGDGMGLSVIVENHGGLSSHGDWLAGVMRAVDHPRVGTLPDFGNFYEYDRYLGVREMLPFAKGVSAKSYFFDDTGEETTINFWRMMKLVRAAEYAGHVGIEYEGDKMSERDGIVATKKLLEEIRAAFTGRP